MKLRKKFCVEIFQKGVKEMADLHIERKASDNKYLHKDFHVTADIGISYVGTNYGDQAVKEYLTQYANSFYKLLAEKVKRNGLTELESNFISVYKKEEWSEFLHTNLTENSLEITIDKCPAITFMKQSGHTPSKWYKETTYVVYSQLAKMCNLDFSVFYYDENDGKTKFVFSKRNNE